MIDKYFCSLRWLWIELLSHTVGICLSLKTTKPFPKVVLPFNIPTSNARELWFPYPTQDLMLLVIPILAIFFVSVKWHLCSFNLHFSDDQSCWISFYLLIAYLILSFWVRLAFGQCGELIWVQLILGLPYTWLLHFHRFSDPRSSSTYYYWKISTYKRTWANQKSTFFFF